MAYTTLAMRSWADVLFDIDGWYKLADLAYLPVLLPAAAAAAAQPILDGAIAEVTKEQDRLMLCSFSEAIDPIVHEIHTTLVEHSMYIEDCWGQCLGDHGGQHPHFDQMLPHVVGRFIVRLGAPGKLNLVLARASADSTRRAGATHAWSRAVPLEVEDGDLGALQLSHGQSYFIGRIAAGADEIGGGLRVSHEVPATPGNSASLVFQISSIESNVTADDTTRLAHAFETRQRCQQHLRSQSPPRPPPQSHGVGPPADDALRPTVLSFDRARPMDDDAWQLWQRSHHARLRQAARAHATALFSGGAEPVAGEDVMPGSGPSVGPNAAAQAHMNACAFRIRKSLEKANQKANLAA